MPTGRGLWQPRRVVAPRPTLAQAGSRARRRRRRRARLLAGSLLVGVIAVAALVFALTRSTGDAAHRVESIFQDDQYLLYSPTPAVAKTFAGLRTLGVDRVRLSIVWGLIAPARNARVRPQRFDGANPADYSAAAWRPYDRAVELARANGIAVDFNVTAPGPLWAMAAPAPNAKAADHYRPSPSAFGQFVLALGRRYSGTYAPPAAAGTRSSKLPRVSYWSVWNEPNQPGWLYPQWRSVAGKRVMDSPRLYRLYVDAAFAALKETGHSPASDSILIGELAPEGRERSRDADPIPPMSFLRALYCVDASYRPLRGAAAGLLHCPVGGAPSAFVAAHPALFDATGLAHHPYSFFLAPSASMSDANFVPLADLARLEHGLDRIFTTYGVHRRLPIYLTEYGYETNPPNPFRGVNPARQSLYLNEAQYLAWKDPRVRSLAQFLLYDSAPDTSYPRGSPGYWSTFQTGLLYVGGQHKPSLDAYRLPIFIPVPATRAGTPVLVWGMLRPGSGTQQAEIQWRPPHGGAYRTLTTVHTSDPDGFLTVHVKPPGTGTVRIAWHSPAGQAFYSRSAGVRVG
jgi:hypothetical protein